MKRRRNNEGTVYYDKQKKAWIAQVFVPTPGGGKKRKKYSYTTEAKAVAGKNKTLSDVHQGQFVPDDRRTLGEFLEQWLTTTVAMRTRPRTYEAYAGMLRLHVIPALGAVKLTAVTPLQVQALLNEKLVSGLSATTVERIRDVLRNALNQALKWGFVRRNVAQLADPPRVEKRRSAPWTVEQVRTFLRAVQDDRLMPLFLVAAATGMRRGELLGLRWQDVDLEDGTLQVSGAVQRIRSQGIVRSPPKTAASERPLAIDPSLCEALARHRERQLLERAFAGSSWVEGDYVFTSRLGTPIDPRNLTRRFEKLSKALGLPQKTFHDLRHFAATVQLMDGAPVNAVQEMLGHSKANTTLDIYGHVTRGVHRARSVRMAELLGIGQTDDPSCPPNCPPEDREEADDDVKPES